MARIAERVALARGGRNPYVIARLPSGWAVMGDVQFLPGYCLLLADPVVPSINDEILGNAEPELHAHIFPRLMSEAADSRRKPAWCYDRATAVRSSEVEHGAIRNAMRDLLRAGS